MKTYQSFAATLGTLLGPDEAVRLNVEGYMPLTIERIGESANGRPLIAISHTAVQNGDLMRDPELVFEIFYNSDTSRYAEPVSFRNDFIGVFQEVYRYNDQGRRTHVIPRLKKELRNFSRMWFRNLREQGFFGQTASREVLE